MKKTLLGTIGVCSLLLIAIVTSSNISLYAQDASSSGEILQKEVLNEGVGGSGLEGVWEARVTLRNCRTGMALATFRAMNMYHQGGTLTDTNAAPPSTRGPGFGTWQSLGGNRYSSLFRFFEFNADGSLLGVRRITNQIRLDSANELNGTVDIVLYDPAGNLTGVGCATTLATRAQ